jgi:hypothetical protein
LQVKIQLSEIEYDLLMDPKWSRGGKGGFQCMAAKMQAIVDRETHIIILDRILLDRIQKTTTYGSGGWQSALRKIFWRHLGPNLSRYAIGTNNYGNRNSNSVAIKATEIHRDRYQASKQRLEGNQLDHTAFE